MALFWGRGRQKWRRPPVRPPSSHARFSSFRRRLNPKIPRGKRGSRRRIDGEKPPPASYPYPNDCNPTPAWLVGARAAKNAWNCQPSAAISVKLRDQRINFPSSVTWTSKDDEMIVNSVPFRSNKTWWKSIDILILLFQWNCRYSVELYWMCCFTKTKKK